VTSATVIIPTHNRKAMVAGAVQHLLDVDFPEDLLQIIVVADRCDDGTECELQNRFGGRLLLLQSSVAGQPGAVNTGLAAASGEVAIIIDDEMFATRDFVSAHVRAHEGSDALIAVSGYSPVKVNRDSSPLHRYLAKRYEAYHDSLSKPRDRISPTDLNGGNMSIRVSVLRDAGGFNEEYFFQRNDFELATRLMERGVQIRYCPDAMADQNLAVTGDVMVARAEPRARADVRLAHEHPWCVTALPFHDQLHGARATLKWKAAWLSRGVLSPSIDAARRMQPSAVLPVRYAYAARYIFETVREAGGWQALHHLLHNEEPWPSPRA